MKKKSWVEQTRTDGRTDGRVANLDEDEVIRVVMVVIISSGVHLLPS